MTSHYEPGCNRSAPSTRPELLEQAARVVAGRRGEYGQPRDLFERVAVRWTQVLGVQVIPAQVALCLIDPKLVRLAHDPRHRDSLIDLIGYGVLLQELIDDASGAEPTAAAEVAEPEGMRWGSGC
jgi:hypothetical protein